MTEQARVDMVRRGCRATHGTHRLCPPSRRPLDRRQRRARGGVVPGDGDPRGLIAERSRHRGFHLDVFHVDGRITEMWSTPPEPYETRRGPTRPDETWADGRPRATARSTVAACPAVPVGHHAQWGGSS